MADKIVVCDMCRQPVSHTEFTWQDGIAYHTGCLFRQWQGQRAEIERLTQENSEQKNRIDQLEELTAVWRYARMQPDLFQREAGDMLVRIAWQAGEISTGRAAELLGVSVAEIRELGWEELPDRHEQQEQIERLTRELELIVETTANKLHHVGHHVLAERFRESKSPLEQRIAMVIHALAARAAGGE